MTQERSKGCRPYPPGERPTPAPPTVLVTHYVTIAAIAGSGVASGEGVLIKHEGEDRYTVKARLRFAE